MKETLNTKQNKNQGGRKAPNTILPIFVFVFQEVREVERERKRVVIKKNNKIFFTQQLALS
jgi:hypothetical protein